MEGQEATHVIWNSNLIQGKKCSYDSIQTLEQLLWEALKSISLKMLKTQMDVALSDLV